MEKDVRLRLIVEAVNRAGAALNDVKRGLDADTAALNKFDAAGKKGTASTEAGLNKVASGAERARAKLERMTASADKMVSAGMQLGMIGAALSAAAFFPIKAAADFERAMSGVLAVTTGAQQNFDALNATAAELGRTTKFTATEVAGGMTFLGMAGFEANEVIKSIPSTLTLAAAGGLELASAADIASNVVQAFQLDVEDLEHVVDVLAVTATGSNTSVAQLAEAMKYAAPAAAAAGVSVEEAAAAIGILGNNGIQASLAGTTMRGMLISLSKVSPQAQAALDKLGVQIKKNEDGSVNLIATLEALGKAHMSLEDATDIFRRQAASGALALSKQTDAAEKLTQANEDSAGAGQHMAKVMEDNLKGAVTLLTSALDGLMRAVGDPLLKPLTELVKTITGVVSAMAAWAEAHPALSGALLTIIGTLGTLLVTLAAVLLAVGGTTKAFALLASGMLGAATKISLVTKGVRGLLVVLRLLAATPWGLAITAVATAGAVAWGLFHKNYSKAADALKNSRKVFSDQVIELKKIKTVLDTTKPGTDDYIAAEEKLARVLPDANVYLDERGRVLAKVGEGYEENNEKLAKYLDYLKKSEMQAFSLEIEATARALDDAEDKLSDYVQNLEDWYGLSVEGSKEADDWASKFWRTLNKFTGTYDKNIEKGEEYRASVEGIKKELQGLLQVAAGKDLSLKEFETALVEAHVSPEIRTRILEAYKMVLSEVAAEEEKKRKEKEAKEKEAAEKIAAEKLRVARENAEKIRDAERDHIKKMASIEQEENDRIYEQGLISTEEYLERKKALALRVSAETLAELKEQLKTATEKGDIVATATVKMKIVEEEARVTGELAGISAEGTEMDQARIDQERAVQEQILQIKKENLGNSVAAQQEAFQIERELFAMETNNILTDLENRKVSESLITEMADAREVAAAQMKADQLKQIDQMRLENAITVFSGMRSVISELYSEMGSQNKALFAAEKAMAIGEVIMNAQVAAAKTEGMMGPLGIPMAAYFYAQMAARIAVITSQALKGMAAGGFISGGSGQKDDVPIMAMGGEYVLRKDAVSKYGLGFVEALNRGIVDLPKQMIRTMSSPITAPAYRFQTGGVVTSRGDSAGTGGGDTNLHIINVTDPRELDRYLATSAGQDAILNVLSSRRMAARRAMS